MNLLMPNRQRPLFERKRKELLVVSFILVFTLFFGWLLFLRFGKSPIDKIPELIKEGKLEEAARLNYNLLAKYPHKQSYLLMYGAVIHYGVRELESADFQLPYYEYEKELLSKDPNGLFYQNSLLMKLELYPYSHYFMQTLCSLFEKNRDIFSDPSVMKKIEPGLHNAVEWRINGNSCLPALIPHSGLEPFRGTITGDKVSLRNNPDKHSSLLMKMNTGDKVLVRKQGVVEKIGSLESPWYYIITTNGQQGWVYGYYLKQSDR